MNPERKIAIAIIKRYRENLDETLRPKEVPEMFIQRQTESAIFFAMGSQPDEDQDEASMRLEANLKEAFRDINNDLMSHVQGEYDRRLTDTIDAAMTRLEAYLVREFIDEELEHLAKIVEDGVVMKLFEKSGMFEILDDEKHNLWAQVNEAFATFSADEGRQQEIKCAVQSAVDKYRAERSEDDPDIDGAFFEFDMPYDSNDLVDPSILDDDDDDDENPF